MLNIRRIGSAEVRATTQLTTRAAPACFSTRAISSSVAPVVITSSTTATRRAGERARAAERAAHVAPALGPRQLHLRRRVALAHAEVELEPAAATWRAISTAWL